MIPVIRGVILVVSGSLIASVVAKATVTSALGLMGAWLMRKSRASVRHACLAATFGVLLVLPVASIFAPPLTIGVPVVAQDGTKLPPLARAIDPIPPITLSPAQGFPEISWPSRLSSSGLLFTGWVAGATLCLLPIIVGLWKIRSLRRSALPWIDGQSVVDGLALGAGIHRSVEVLLHEALEGPMTCGVVRPAIVLPPDAQTWEEEDLKRAIVHELEHVRRRDWVSHCLSRAVCAVYWFHPLVWIAWRQLTLSAEQSCDDAVVGHSEAIAYADQLVALARRLSIPAKSPLLAMANRADLAARVGAVLDGVQRRGRAGARAVAFACIAAALLVVMMSPLRIVAAVQSVPAQKTAGGSPSIGGTYSKIQFEVASVKPSPPPDPNGIMVGCNGGPGSTDPGLFTCTHFNVSNLVGMAFQLSSYQQPQADYGDRAMYDISAKVPPGTTKEQFNLMLRNLVIERFKLAYHYEKKEMQVYDVGVAKGGLKMKESPSAVPEAVKGGEEAEAPLPPLGKVDLDAEGFPKVAVPKRGSSSMTMTNGRARWMSTDTSMEQVVSMLTNQLGAPVTDSTGLQGKYDFMLSWVAENNPAADSSGPTLIEAVREQLGLRLERKKGLADVFVIDHVEKVPVEN
jgi:uncharacterized protein (TIGR03435 family)